jgi:hypothetical protein
MIQHMVAIFTKMKEAIAQKIGQHQKGLYVAILFPIFAAFLLTFVGARILSHYAPQFFIEWSSGVRVHHFAYGFFVLAAAGYLAMVHHGPRATYWNAWLFGFGLGLSMDELGMWLLLRDDDPTRWSYDGLTIVVVAIVLIIVAKPGIRFFKQHLWPFGK